jgi:hypothetical protein
MFFDLTHLPETAPHLPRFAHPADSCLTRLLRASWYLSSHPTLQSRIPDPVGFIRSSPALVRIPENFSAREIMSNG